MLLEAIISPKTAEKRPFVMMLVGFFYAGLAMLLSYIIQREHASIIMVFLAVIASMPLVYNIIKYEEDKDEHTTDRKLLLKEHSKALMAFLFLFLGMTIAFSLANAFLPTEISDNMFSAQKNTITSINGNATKAGAFNLPDIIFNNFGVLFFCILFSLLYGLGAIYILTWNASILGTAIGIFISTNLAKLAHLVGSEKVAGYFKVYSCGYFVRYLPHGILEILAYFTAGLAGGIIYIAIVRHTFGTKKFTTVFLDSADLLIISIVTIILAGIVEVFVTPGFFFGLCG